MARPANDSPAAVRAAELEFQSDMREFGRGLSTPGSASPEVLAESFYRLAGTVSGQWPAGSEQRGRYLAGIRMQVRNEAGMSAAPDPLYERFLSRLLSMLDEAKGTSRG